MSTIKTKPCTSGPRHSWQWKKNVTVGSLTITSRSSTGRYTLKGLYTCACGATKHGQPDMNGTDLRGTI